MCTGDIEKNATFRSSNTTAGMQVMLWLFIKHPELQKTRMQNQQWTYIFFSLNIGGRDDCFVLWEWSVNVCVLVCHLWSERSEMICAFDLKLSKKKEGLKYIQNKCTAKASHCGGIIFPLVYRWFHIFIGWPKKNNQKSI